MLNIPHDQSSVSARANCGQRFESGSCLDGLTNKRIGDAFDVLEIADDTRSAAPVIGLKETASVMDGNDLGCIAMLYHSSLLHDHFINKPSSLLIAILLPSF